MRSTRWECAFRTCRGVVQCTAQCSVAATWNRNLVVAGAMTVQLTVKEEKVYTGTMQVNTT